MLSIHLMATIARLLGPGGMRSVVVEPVWYKNSAGP